MTSYRAILDSSRDRLSVNLNSGFYFLVFVLHIARHPHKITAVDGHVKE